MRKVLLLTTLLLTPGLPLAGPPSLLPTPTQPFKLLLHAPTNEPAPNLKCDMAFARSLLTLVQGAKTSIDFAIYGLRGQQEILDALVAAKERGVVVRGVVDRTVDGKNYYAHTEELVRRLGTVRDDLAVDLRRQKQVRPYSAATSTCWAPAPPGFLGPKQCLGYDLGDRCLLAVHASEEELRFQGDIMHDKFFVVDGRYVWMGSTNVSDSCSGGYNSNLVGIVDSPVVAGWYRNEFEQMWQGRQHQEKVSQGPMQAVLTDTLSVEVLFSPQDEPITRGVRPLLQKARERIDVAIFFLTHKGIAADLIAAHRRGVKVRVVMDATAAKNGYAKHELVRAAGVPVKIEDWGGKMHMKAAAIDGHTVITGSMNWTSAGENGNDENTIIVSSREHAAQFHAWYDQLWTSIPDRWLQGRPDPESRDSGTSCTDGVDNDYDHTADAEDPGCGPNPPPLPDLPPYVIVPKEGGPGVLKGNISESGRRTYHVPGGEWYDKVRVDPSIGEGWFCSEEDARRAGFSRSSQ